MQKNKLK